MEDTKGLNMRMLHHYLIEVLNYNGIGNDEHNHDTIIDMVDELVLGDNKSESASWTNSHKLIDRDEVAIYCIAYLTDAGEIIVSINDASGNHLTRDPLARSRGTWLLTEQAIDRMYKEGN